MGAISSEASVPVLKKYLHDPERAVRETCEIALAKIEWDHSEEAKKQTPPEEAYVISIIHEAHLSLNGSVYTSIDPAPPSSGLLSSKPAPSAVSSESIETLRTTLTNPSLPLFERYRAMFALRNIGTQEAVVALASGFTDDSALFKYVTKICKRNVSNCL